MSFLDDVFDLFDGADDDVSDEDHGASALIPHEDSALAGADRSHRGVLESDVHVLQPGDPHSLVICLGHPDPILLASSYRFEPFLMDAGDPLLVDLNGDGIPDHTRWGTPVERVDGYMRADGTEVRGHYRTVADGVSWNNLDNWR